MLRNKITKMLALTMILGIAASATPAKNVNAEMNLTIAASEEVDANNAIIERELGYAVTEIEIAIGLLNEGCNDYEKVLGYAAPAIERVRPMDISEDSPLFDDYKYVVDGYGYVLETCTERYNYAYEQLHHAHVEILTALNELRTAEGTPGGKTEEAKARIQAFARTAVERIRPEMENKGTMYTYWKAYYEEISRLYGEITIALTEWVFDGSEEDNYLNPNFPVGDGSAEDDMQVDQVHPPILDGSGDDNFLRPELPELPEVGDGSADDNIQLPEAGDGSEEDNYLNPNFPVGDGSAEDNMEVEPPVGDGSSEDNMQVKPEEVKGDTLPNTGAVAGSALSLLLGTGLAGAGFSLSRKRK